MSVGDVYELSIPPALAFGTKGRRASAGKPSIPAGAYVTVRLVVLPIPPWPLWWGAGMPLHCILVCVLPATVFDHSELTRPMHLT